MTASRVSHCHHSGASQRVASRFVFVGGGLAASWSFWPCGPARRGEGDDLCFYFFFSSFRVRSIIANRDKNKIQSRLTIIEFFRICFFEILTYTVHTHPRNTCPLQNDIRRKKMCFNLCCVHSVKTIDTNPLNCNLFINIYIVNCNRYILHNVFYLWSVVRTYSL